MQLATAKDSVQSDTTASISQAKEARAKAGAAWIPYVLAIFFFLSALWGVGNTDVVDTDAARHAMNGAFMYDMIRGGHIMHPIEYAKQYYGHRPALSMPYHPPLFPAIEAVLFALLGVKLLTARIAVAMSVGICALLLYRLVQSTLASNMLAACVTVTTFSLWTAQTVSRDVMLEYPALTFTLSALYCLRERDRTFTIGRALLFGLLAGAAVWTKQHTVFLGAVPILCTLRKGQRHLLLEKPLWIATAIQGAAVLCLIALSKQANGTGIDQVNTSVKDIHWIFTYTAPAYFTWIVADMRGFAGCFAFTVIAVYLASLRKRSGKTAHLGIYFAWIFSYALVLLALGDINSRYLFFAFPASITIGYAWLFQGCASFWGERRAQIVTYGFALAWLVIGFFVPREFLRGPGEAAAFVTQGSPARILYAGEADGNFIFAIRSLDPQLQMTVIPAGKLPPSSFEPDALEEFCRRYGVDWIVFENVQSKHTWSILADARPAFLKLERSFPIASSRSRWRTGTIDVYRFIIPPNPAGGVLELPVHKIGGSIGVKL
jgi:4-amino-4-deoxy-L-arabinose transferase-like glycosyltransferase